MKKILVSLIFIPIVVITGFSLVNNSVDSEEEITSVENTEQVLGENIAEPKRLVITKLDIETNIEHVGADSEGRMDVPQNNANVAWWEPGVMPGEKGSAVLAGHYDNPDGSPSVFYNLEKLNRADIVTVLDQDGGQIEFEVIDKKYYKDANFPIDIVFEQDDANYLNLITCAGAFDRESKNYTDRLVVFTKQTTM